MARGGAKNTHEGPERKCLVTQESGPKAGLIRFVTGPDGAVVPDVMGKLPGRGYYVTAERAILEQAVAKRVFARGAKQQVTVTDGMVALIETQLAARVIHYVALARKAGQAVAGFEKVKSWLSKEDVKVLLQASDGSERGKAKLWTPEGARYFNCLSSEELGMAFGRGTVIHGAVSAGGLSKHIVEDAAKLRGLRENAGAGPRPTGKDDKV